ncbi:MAG: SOS response-associated peptidase family protein [Yersiniaceae bacterium]|nr:SOS response-associated peptidase family protein [Yersiniaceae bacterium]
MCGRFSQHRTRSEYLDALAPEIPFNGALDPVPVDRYNVAPGTRVLLLNQRDDQLCLDPVRWGYQPHWAKEAHRPPVINARVETAAGSRMFKPLWQHGRALVMADGWFEWKKDPDDAKRKQPYFIYHQSDAPLFFAAISKFHPDALEPPEDDGFVIVTAASDAGLLDIHDRRPLVLTPEAARAWLDPALSPEEAGTLASEGAVPVEEFSWHPVDKAVGNPHHQGHELLAPIDNPLV